jgi:hypothetical protein
MRVRTIGFTRKPASRFFELLRSSEAKRVVDVRLNNVSQLAGFAKKEDLAYFLKEICGMHYVHLPELAPTQEMLDEYKKRHGDWKTYETRFLALIDPVPRPHEVKTHRGDVVERDNSRWLLALQRGQTAPLPPSARRRIPQAALERRGNRSPWIGTRRWHGDQAITR